MTAKSTKRGHGHADNASSQNAQASPANPFLIRFLNTPQIGKRDSGKTIYTRVERETTDDR